MVSLLSGGILGLLTPPGAAIGTGALKIVEKTGTDIPSSVVDQILLEMPPLFGGYPGNGDVAPSAVFIAVFTLIAFGHGYVFFKNRHFYPSLGLCIYALFRMAGFAMRVSWSKNVLRIKLGVASTSFSLVSVLYLNIMTALLGHRVLEARNPKLGGAWWFKLGMTIIYVVVLGIIAMAIVGQSIPYLYFLSPSHYNMCKKVVRAASIFEILYSLLGGALIILAACLRVTARHFHHDEPAAAAAETTPAADAEKASDSEHSNKDGVAAPTPAAAPAGTTPNHLKISRVQALHIIGASALLTFNCCFRCASTFTMSPTNWIFDKTVFYVLYGAVEVIVNFFYLGFKIQDHFNY